MKKAISILLTFVIIMGILTGCSGNSYHTYSTPTPTENPLKSGYYTDLDGKQAYVVVGKLSHIVINCTNRFVPWENRDSVSKNEIQAYLVVITPIEGENFSIYFDESKLEQVTKFTEPNEGYFRVYLTEPKGILLKGPEWINNMSTDISSKSQSNNMQKGYESYSNVHQMLLGSWVQPNANLIWIFHESEFIIDYSEAYPGDNSIQAEYIRNLPSSHVDYTMDGDYIIFDMAQASYRNKVSITGNILKITNSIDGKVSTYYRKDTVNESIDISAEHDTPYIQKNDNAVIAEMKLNYGKITLALYPDIAPKTVEHFIELANSGFYNGTIFHRVIDDFMIQGGGYDQNLDKKTADTVEGEFSENGFENNLSHTRGVISMARAKDMNSATSQFFIVQKDASYLDGEYAAFGRVIDGLDVVDKIASVKTGSVQSKNMEDVPVDPVIIQSITIVN